MSPLDLALWAEWMRPIGMALALLVLAFIAASELLP